MEMYIIIGVVAVVVLFILFKLIAGGGKRPGDRYPGRSGDGVQGKGWYMSEFEIERQLFDEHKIQYAKDNYDDKQHEKIDIDIKKMDAITKKSLAAHEKLSKKVETKKTKKAKKAESEEKTEE